MRIALHNGPFANQGYEVVSTDEAPPRIMYPFSHLPIYRDDVHVYLDAHVYSLQSMRGSQTSWAYVYAGVQHLGLWESVEQATDIRIDDEVSDIVSLDGVEIEAPKRPRGRPRKVTAAQEV
jgi:hypothetical protein